MIVCLFRWPAVLKFFSHKSMKSHFHMGQIKFLHINWYIERLLILSVWIVYHRTSLSDLLSFYVKIWKNSLCIRCLLVNSWSSAHSCFWTEYPSQAIFWAFLRSVHQLQNFAHYFGIPHFQSFSAISSHFTTFFKKINIFQPFSPMYSHSLDSQIPLEFFGFLVI